MKTLDLGEFENLRRPILILIPVGWFLTIRYVDEFLAVRSLGILFLLAAEPLLEAAFLRPEQSRLLLTLLAYLWVVLGMFWIGMPYLLRDQISWLVANPTRWNIAVGAGLVYGLAIVLLGVTV